MCAIRCDGYGLTQRHQATKEDHSARAAFVMGSHRGLPLHDPCPRSRGLNPPPAASRPPPPAGDTQARTRQSHVRRTCFLPAGDTQARTRQSCVRCSCPPLAEVNRHWLIRGGCFPSLVAALLRQAVLRHNRSYPKTGPLLTFIYNSIYPNIYGFSTRLAGGTGPGAAPEPAGRRLLTSFRASRNPVGIRAHDVTPPFNVFSAQAGIQWVRVVVQGYGSGPLLSQG